MDFFDFPNLPRPDRRRGGVIDRKQAEDALAQYLGERALRRKRLKSLLALMGQTLDEERPNFGTIIHLMVVAPKLQKGSGRLAGVWEGIIADTALLLGDAIIEHAPSFPLTWMVEVPKTKQFRHYFVVGGFNDKEQLMNPESIVLAFVRDHLDQVAKPSSYRFLQNVLRLVDIHNGVSSGG